MGAQGHRQAPPLPGPEGKNVHTSRLSSKATSAPPHSLWALGKARVPLTASSKSPKLCPPVQTRKCSLQAWDPTPLHTLRASQESLRPLCSGGSGAGEEAGRLLLPCFRSHLFLGLPKQVGFAGQGSTQRGQRENFTATMPSNGHLRAYLPFLLARYHLSWVGRSVTSTSEHLCASDSPCLWQTGPGMLG